MREQLWITRRPGGGSRERRLPILRESDDVQAVVVGDHPGCAVVQPVADENTDWATVDRELRRCSSGTQQLACGTTRTGRRLKIARIAELMGSVRCTWHASGLYIAVVAGSMRDLTFCRPRLGRAPVLRERLEARQE